MVFGCPALEVAAGMKHRDSRSTVLKSSADAVIHESFLGRIEDIESFVASKTDLVLGQLKKQKDVPRQHRAPYISMRRLKCSIKHADAV
ncbi:hypothetical protein EJB05_09960, partial [Eragrostis curvula]